MSDYAEGCIHLIACRRMQKIERNKGIAITRHCDEKCSAYTSIKEIRDGVQTIVDDAIYDIKFGWNTYTVTEEQIERMLESLRITN